MKITSNIRQLNTCFGLEQSTPPSPGTITGGGTLNFIPKFTPDGSTIGNSQLFDNGISLGYNTITPDASAAIDITSTTQGFLMPRLTAVQAGVLFGAAPATGLLIFNSTTKRFNYWDGASILVLDTNVGDYSDGGNAFGANATIGLTDNFDLSILTNNLVRATVTSAGLFGIGTIAPVTNLEVAADDANSFIVSTRYSSDTSPSAFIARKARGTQAGPTAVLSGDSVGDFAAAGYHTGAAFGNASGKIQFYAAENYTAIARGTNVGIFLAPIGGTTPVELVTVYENGVIGAGATAGAANGSLSIGYMSGNFVDTNNTFIGVRSGQNIALGGNSNTALGSNSLNALVTGFNNTALGYEALLVLSGAGQNNTAIGYTALNSFDNAADICDAVGSKALHSLTSGNGNVAFGYLSLGALQTGTNNTAIGQSAGGGLNAASTGNTLIGYFAGDGGAAHSASQNTIIGASAGQNVTGSGNVIIGYQSNATVLAAMNNTLWIDVGNNAIPLIYGDFSTKQVALGTVSPDASSIFEIVSTTQFFRLKPMTAAQASLITPAEGDFVSVSTTDATFTAVGVWSYYGGAWNQL